MRQWSGIGVLTVLTPTAVTLAQPANVAEKPPALRELYGERKHEELQESIKALLHASEKRSLGTQSDKWRDLVKKYEALRQDPSLETDEAFKSGLIDDSQARWFVPGSKSSPMYKRWFRDDQNFVRPGVVSPLSPSPLTNPLPQEQGPKKTVSAAMSFLLDKPNFGSGILTDQIVGSRGQDPKNVNLDLPDLSFTKKSEVTETPAPPNPSSFEKMIAQDEQVRAAWKGFVLEWISKGKSDLSVQGVDAEAELRRSVLKDPAVQEAWKQWTIKWIQANESELAESKRALAGHNIMSIVVGVAVHCVLFVSLGVAVMEFVSAMAIRKRASRSRKQNTPTSEAEEARIQEIEIKADGIALKTSLHGTALLAFSLVFYFLFVFLVLPVVSSTK